MLSPFFYPEPISTGRYNSFLAMALAQKGNSVDVICFHPIYPDWHPTHCENELPGVNILRGGEWIRFPKKIILRRAVLELGFLLHFLRYINRIKTYTHIVAVLPPMLFLPLLRLVADPNIKITAIVHDLQGIMAGVDLNKKSSILLGIIRILERLVLGCCHKVIALSSSMASFITKSYKIPSSKITICWPFVSVESQNSPSQLDYLFAKGKKHVVYAGALGKKQNPQGLLSFFLELINRRSDVICHLFSAGPIFETYQRLYKTANKRLKFHNLVPDKDLFELYQRSHIQVIPEQIGFSDGAIPSKLPNLLASGAPVLYIGQKNSDVRYIIEKANAGMCSDSWDPKKLCVIIECVLVESASRSHKERRLAFNEKFAALFSVESLIKELLMQFDNEKNRLV
jgi:glycosyltransferase involved in cell wall biosynthesis